MGVALTGLKLLLVHVRAECVVGRVRLGHSIHWFVYETELGKERTRCQYHQCVCKLIWVMD